MNIKKTYGDLVLEDMLSYFPDFMEEDLAEILEGLIEMGHIDDFEIESEEETLVDVELDPSTNDNIIEEEDTNG